MIFTVLFESRINRIIALMPTTISMILKATKHQLRWHFDFRLAKNPARQQGAFGG
jgi:hypothetical protein